ncbi:hypothetical protein [Nocardia concava]|uniref:hypothetical protein n=1 Tax=Nocardia concava TaxID=257281 RepID=UPI000593E4DC|nr:hypothetical protein [Nocardia concava]
MVIAAIFFGIGFLIAIPFTLDASRAGNSLKTFYGVAIALVCLSFVAAASLNLRVRRKRLPSGIIDGAVDGIVGLRLSLVRYWRAILAMWLIAGTVFMIARAALVLRQLFSHDADGQGTGVALEVTQLVIAVAVIGAFAFLAVFLFTGRRDNHVTLDEAGLVRVSGPVTKSIAWEDIAVVTPFLANETPMVRIVPTSGTSFQTDTGKSRAARWGRQRADRQMDLPALAFGIDPALLLHLVQFYQRHPEDRHELRSTAVLDRIRSGKLMG